MANQSDIFDHLADVVSLSLFIYDLIYKIGVPAVKDCMELCGRAPFIEMLVEAEEAMYNHENGLYSNQILRREYSFFYYYCKT